MKEDFEYLLCYEDESLVSEHLILWVYWGGNESGYEWEFSSLSEKELSIWLIDLCCELAI